MHSSQLRGGEKTFASLLPTYTVASHYVPDRVISGAIVAAVIAFAAFRSRALTRSGALAAFAAGTISMAAGWGWGALLFAMFLTSSVLSRLGERKKGMRLDDVIEKGGRRDALQVAANGSLYVAAAAALAASGGSHWYAVGVGALAASTADTWSTEIGTLRGRVPRMIVSGKRVPVGTSGGITLAGTIGALAGAMFVGGAARLAEWPVAFSAVAGGGLAGAFADSALGATIQSKRWCERCASATERTVHACGAPTIHSGGIGWLDNDAVNLVSTIIGGLVTLVLSGIGRAG